MALAGATKNLCFGCCTILGNLAFTGYRLAQMALMATRARQVHFCLAQANTQNLELRHYLAKNDSATFFSKLGDQFITGATGHNLNDIRLLFVE